MAMSKKDFIALADAIRSIEPEAHPALLNRDIAQYRLEGKHEQQLHLINALAKFCCEQNPRFMRDRWLGYIRGECGSNGGQIKPDKPKRVRRGAAIEGLDYIDEHGAIRMRKVGA